MSDAFQIDTAAQESGEALALITASERYSFGDLAQASRPFASGPRVIRNNDAMDTLFHVYAALQDERPLCILPGAASDDEVFHYQERMAGVASDIALVLQTSGSEGRAKAVMLPRSALLASAEASAAYYGWQDDDRWLCCLPLHHIGGLSVFLRCLSARKPAVLSDGFDTEQVVAMLAEHRVSKVSLVPTMLWRLLENNHEPPPTLRLVLVGGAALDPFLLSRARAAGYPVVHSYGMTETASQIIVLGQPLRGVETRVCDNRLEVRGPMLMRGYLQPDDREQAIVDGWLRTNDRARILADGRVEILGRGDRVIISGGENIDPAVVEHALLQCAGVSAAIALGVPHPEWGQKLVALVVADPSRGSRTIESELGTRLASHLRPKALVRIDALPLLDNGKIDRRKALEIAIAAP